ncbi:hypothetical protein K474DRAFT_1777089 [Panus rudis PR-1116 ss-1]|nr:hypothetical protein K474DRAFT_1777089 [Panus rudis PR-1116 ss-1]
MSANCGTALNSGDAESITALKGIPGKSRRKPSLATLRDLVLKRTEANDITSTPIKTEPTATLHYKIVQSIKAMKAKKNQSKNAESRPGTPTGKNNNDDKAKKSEGKNYDSDSGPVTPKRKCGESSAVANARVLVWIPGVTHTPVASGRPKPAVSKAAPGSPRSPFINGNSPRSPSVPSSPSGTGTPHSSLRGPLSGGVMLGIPQTDEVSEETVGSPGSSSGSQSYRRRRVRPVINPYHVPVSA